MKHLKRFNENFSIPSEIQFLKDLDNDTITELVNNWENELKEQHPDEDKLRAYADDIGIILDNEVGKPKSDTIYNYLCNVITEKGVDITSL